MAIKKPVSKKKYKLKFRFNLKNLAAWLLVFFGALLVLGMFMPTETLPEEIPLSQVIADIKADQVERVEVAEDKLFVTYGDEVERMARKEPGVSFTEISANAEIDPTTVEVAVRDVSLSQVWSDILLTILPLGLMAVFFLFIFRQARGAQDSLFSFGRSKAKLFAKGKQSTTFKDVAGVDEAKKELEEVVDFLKNPGKYRKLGARTPKGVLLVGPAGVGKTLLAKAVAGEANVPFFSMAGSEFMEMLVGVGASRVRDLFANAKKSAPAIIFIDEVESIGRQRGMGAMAGGHSEQEQTLNQILVEMDGFTPNDNVIILAASNRPDLLDPALLRPGRFDRRITLDMPDLQDRGAIIQIHAKGKPFVKGIDWQKVAKRTVGFSGADIENMLNEAAIQAARENRTAITMADIEEAATRVKLGPEKRRLQSEEERRMTAYHEAGHAIVTHLLPKMDPVHRVSIVSRGLALGYTLIPPKKDRYNETKSHLEEIVASLMGGRAAEELVFGEFTAGAASDIDKATQIARRMVIDYGMSQLGPINLGPQVETTEYGRMWMQPSELSQAMQGKVDAEIKRIVDRAYKNALGLLKGNRKMLDKVASRLLEIETIEDTEFEKMVGKKISADGKAD